MASFVKFHDFARAMANKEHDLENDTLAIYLTNATPSASGDAVKADLAEISTGNGYSGPIDITNTEASTGGTTTITGSKVTITASGGSIGPFQAVVLCNLTHASAALIGYWDIGSAVTIVDGGPPFEWKPNNSATTGTLLTLS